MFCTFATLLCVKRDNFRKLRTETHKGLQWKSFADSYGQRLQRKARITPKE
jgi:hypothetical protein